jgi:hypothetical protein
MFIIIPVFGTDSFRLRRCPDGKLDRTGYQTHGVRWCYGSLELKKHFRFYRMRAVTFLDLGEPSHLTVTSEDGGPHDFPPEWPYGRCVKDPPGKLFLQQRTGRRVSITTCDRNLQSVKPEWVTESPTVSGKPYLRLSTSRLGRYEYP